MPDMDTNPNLEGIRNSKISKVLGRKLLIPTSNSCKETATR